MHRQETVECLKKFNARRKLKVRFMVTHTCSLNSNFTHAEVIFPLSAHRGPSSPPCLCHGTSLVSYSGMMQMEMNFWTVLIDSWVDRCVCVFWLVCSVYVLMVLQGIVCVSFRSPLHLDVLCCLSCVQIKVTHGQDCPCYTGFIELYTDFVALTSI